MEDIELTMRSVAELRETLDEGNIIEKRLFCKSFVKEIEIRKQEAVLRYTVPLWQREEQGRAEEVLPIVPLGGAGGT